MDHDVLQAADDWVPVELELVDRMWIPDAEILKLKGFRSHKIIMMMIFKNQILYYD